MALLDDVKQACRVTSTAYNTELTDLIQAALADMGITDIRADVLTETPPPLVKMAVKTYCRMHFGEVEDGERDRLEASYNEQKSQLLMSSLYNGWGV